MVLRMRWSSGGAWAVPAGRGPNVSQKAKDMTWSCDSGTAGWQRSASAPSTVSEQQPPPPPLPDTSTPQNKGPLPNWQPRCSACFPYTTRNALSINFSRYMTWSAAIPRPSVLPEGPATGHSKQPGRSLPCGGSHLCLLMDHCRDMSRAQGTNRRQNMFNSQCSLASAVLVHGSQLWTGLARLKMQAGVGILFAVPILDRRGCMGSAPAPPASAGKEHRDELYFKCRSSAQHGAFIHDVRNLKWFPCMASLRHPTPCPPRAGKIWPSTKPRTK